MTEAQAQALAEIRELGGSISNGMGISTSTIRALERLGYVEVRWGKRTERMAPQGWTGRVYVDQSWWAQIKEGIS